MFLHWACRENENDLPINYVLLIEHPEIDGKLRKKLREKIFKQLPVNLKENESIKMMVFLLKFKDAKHAKNLLSKLKRLNKKFHSLSLL